MALDQITIKNTLLSIYSNNNLNEIDDKKIVQAFFPNEVMTDESIKLRKEELANNTAYLKTKEILSDCRENIEAYVLNGDNITPEDEIKSILFKVVFNRAIYYSSKLGKDDIRYNQQMNTLNDLTVAIFITSGKWNKRLADHYYFVYPFLKDWYSYFLSYTNKSAFNLNKRFETLLNFSNVSNQKNQVARFIADTLCKTENIPNGFIDENEIEPGEIFPQKIKDALGKSFSFIQVVSKETFTLQGTNWCKLEYEEYKNSLGQFIKGINNDYNKAFTDNIIYLIMAQTLDEVKPAIDFPEYKEWLNDMTVRHQVANLVMQKDFDSFMKNITTIAQRIISLKNNLINMIPN